MAKAMIGMVGVLSVGFGKMLACPDTGHCELFQSNSSWLEVFPNFQADGGF